MARVTRDQDERVPSRGCSPLSAAAGGGRAVVSGDGASLTTVRRCSSAWFVSYSVQLYVEEDGEEAVPTMLSMVLCSARPTFRSREHKNTLKRVISESRIGSPAWFELNRSEAQSNILRKIGVFDLTNQMVRFWQTQSSPATRANDGDMANLHLSDVWARECKDCG
jgi:hypothetical protein